MGCKQRPRNPKLPILHQLYHQSLVIQNPRQARILGCTRHWRSMGSVPIHNVAEPRIRVRVLRDSLPTHERIGAKRLLRPRLRFG